MRIAVIGRGNVGGRLAERWARAGHVVTTIGRDGGYEPVYVGGLEHARALQDQLGIVFATGPGFHRYWKPGEL